MGTTKSAFTADLILPTNPYTIRIEDDVPHRNQGGEV